MQRRPALPDAAALARLRGAQLDLGANTLQRRAGVAALACPLTLRVTAVHRPCCCLQGCHARLAACRCPAGGGACNWCDCTPHPCTARCCCCPAGGSSGSSGSAGRSCGCRWGRARAATCPRRSRQQCWFRGGSGSGSSRPGCSSPSSCEEGASGGSAGSGSGCCSARHRHPDPAIQAAAHARRRRRRAQPQTGSARRCIQHVWRQLMYIADP